MCGFQYHSFENCPSKRGSRDAIVGAVWVTTMALPEISVSIRSTKAASRKASALAWLALMPISRLSFMRSEEHTSELQSLMRLSYAVFCLTKKKPTQSIFYYHNTIVL